MSAFDGNDGQQQDEEHRPFVKIQGINADDARRRREDLTVSIRKNKREETLLKRRRAVEVEGPGLVQVSENVRSSPFLFLLAGQLPKPQNMILIRLTPLCASMS
jgi:hypothetical protein